MKTRFILSLTAALLTMNALAQNRPQTPQPPFPYQTEEVSFTNDEAGATFAGTLTLPADAKCVLLMVTGSGQQNRDEEILDHKPFAVIADQLARHGIATLRYDDRGFGQSSGGDLLNATSRDFADDAAAGIRWLRQSGRFPKVGILGHSEGGEIAFMLGAEGMVDFIVSLAGPGVSGDSILLEQNRALFGELVAGLTIDDIRNNPQIQQVPWYRYFINYDPQQDLARITCPVMALNGEKDCQVPAAMNLNAIRRNLPANGHHLFKSYPDLNHLFQHCETGLPDEYQNIEETFSEEVLNDISIWLQQFAE